MTEDEAQTAVAAIVGGAGMERLTQLVALVIAENDRQNLIARSTVATIWNRHVLDSVQLLRHAPEEGLWLDIGTGGGFPGLAIAAAMPRPMMLVEPRRRRADFLSEAAAALQLSGVTVHRCKVEAVHTPVAIISARAVSPPVALLQAARSCSTPDTRWLFLRGRSTPEEVDALRRQTAMVFHVEQSLSDPASSLLVGEDSSS